MTAHNVPRILPELNEANEFFWRSGADGRLRFQRCDSCGYFVHPAGPICPSCLARELSAAPVSGFATLVSFAVNHQRWVPSLDVPYLLGLVEFPEQAGLRLTTNIVGADADGLTIGMSMKLVFEQAADLFIPLFTPALPRADAQAAA